MSFESAFYPDKRALTAAESVEAARVFAAWESTLHASGGPWLAGSLSLADLAFVPTVVRLLAHTPIPDAYPAAAGWARRLRERPAVVRWLQEAQALPPVYLEGYRA